MWARVSGPDAPKWVHRALDASPMSRIVPEERSSGAMVCSDAFLRACVRVHRQTCVSAESAVHLEERSAVVRSFPLVVFVRACVHLYLCVRAQTSSCLSFKSRPVVGADQGSGLVCALRLCVLTCIHVYARMCACVLACLRMCMNTCMHACARVPVYVRTCVCVRVCMHAFVCAHTCERAFTWVGVFHARICAFF